MEYKANQVGHRWVSTVKYNLIVQLRDTSIQPMPTTSPKPAGFRMQSNAGPLEATIDHLRLAIRLGVIRNAGLDSRGLQLKKLSLEMAHENHVTNRDDCELNKIGRNTM